MKTHKLPLVAAAIIGFAFSLVAAAQTASCDSDQSSSPTSSDTAACCAQSAKPADTACAKAASEKCACKCTTGEKCCCEKDQCDCKKSDCCEASTADKSASQTTQKSEDKVTYCSQSCEKRAEKIAAAGTASPANAPAGYPLKTCVVSGGELGSMGAPYVYVYKQEGKPDRTVVFCCKGCVRKFEKNPAKYLAILDAATTTVEK